MINQRTRRATHSAAVLTVTAVMMVMGCGKAVEPGFAGSGVIEATEVTVSAETAGRIITLECEEGASVDSGQVIARIDVESLALQRDVSAADLDELAWNKKIYERELAVGEEQREQARITLDNVTLTRDRTVALATDKAVTQERLDRAMTEHALAQSALKLADKRIDELRTRIASLEARRAKIDANLRLIDNHIADGIITAPLGGVVLDKTREEGETVGAGIPICAIADLTTVWLTVYVTEPMLGNLSLGGKAAVRIDSHPDERFPGTIAWIAPEAEFTPKNVQTRDSRAELVYAVKIMLPNEKGIFKIGMPADAFIEGL